MDQTVDDDDKSSVPSDSSIYADSDEERIVLNSTDEEVESYSNFNEKIDMINPTFKVEMRFKMPLFSDRPLRSMP